jgi:hypothetical protein
MKIKSPLLYAAVLSGLSLLLAACGSGGYDDDGARMKLSVADAPVDGAQAVVVKFTGVELTPGSGGPVTITLSQPKSIDLLSQSGTASAVLFDEPIPSGSYGQIRLAVVADGDPANSYITLSDGTQHGLDIPSGDQTGLKLVSGFEVPGSGVVNYTVDFDLRKAITCPPGQNGVCFLKPALRLVNNDTVGAIQGTVSATLVPDGCTPGVYLYNGSPLLPADMNTTATDQTTQPIASKVPAVTSTSNGGYYYQFTFLPPGPYTLAFTCLAALDNADQADAAVLFAPVKSGISVSAAQTATVDFP